MTYIKFANVCLKGDGKNILNNVSFDIEKNDVCLIVSPSLSGILNIIATDLNTFTGVVLVDDVLINSLNKKDRKLYMKKIARIHPDNDLIKNLTIYENIYLSCEINKNTNKVSYYINKLGLSKKQHMYPAQLKEFDIQKAKLAMMLAKKADIVLYDGIDLLQKNQRIKILNVLQNVSKNDKVTVFIESKTNELSKGCNKVITIKNGEAKIKINKKPKKAGDL